MAQMTRPTLVVYGAGNIGRGIVSLLFGEAGYHLLFYRRDREALLNMQARGGYVIHRQGGGEDVPVSGFDVLTGQEELLRALAGCDLTACCLYPGAFPQAGAVLAEACRMRTDPLNVLLCCNESGGAELLSRSAAQALPPKERDGIFQKLRIVPTIVYSAGFPTLDGGTYDVTVSTWRRNAVPFPALSRRCRAWSWWTGWMHGCTASSIWATCSTPTRRSWGSGAGMRT